MNGLNINNLLSKKMGIALTAIYIVGKAGADPTITIICQTVIAIATIASQFLLDKEKQNENVSNSNVPADD